ncbi:MAG: type II toxin-antitoxin system RelE/ParE family toxin [Varibaculum cambriense]|nr:type II toxin-antitoxin system RelE/ParE family toxin [Varibaculum cambriense]
MRYPLNLLRRNFSFFHSLILPQLVASCLLRGNYVGQWRYRIGNYRLICEIEDDHFYIQALAIGHSKEIYR